MLYWSSRVKKCSHFKYRPFPHPFCQKMSPFLDRAKKKVKNYYSFNKTSKKRSPPNSGQF